MARLAKWSIGVEEPEWQPGQKYDWRQHQAAEEQAIKDAVAEAQAERPGTLAGEIVAWQRADGYARYMILSEKPLVLVHVATCDAYQIEAALIRGLRLSDVRAMVKRDEAMRKLFSGGAK